MLTVKQIEAAKPKEKPYRLLDGNGLYLYVPVRELQALMHASIASMVCSALMMRKMQIQTSINISRTQQQSNQNHHLHLNRF